FAVSGRKTAGERLPAIKLDKEHAVEVIGLIPPLLYFLVILAKRSFGWVDAVVLIALYVAYLWVLFKNPPHDAEKVSSAPAVSRWAYRQRGWRRAAVRDGPSLPRVDARRGGRRGREPVRAGAVGGAVSLRIPREGLGVLLGAARHARADGPDEPRVEQHQPVDRAR